MLFLFHSFWFLHLPLTKEPYHYLRFEKDSRYYELRLIKDLLDDWTLVTSNGPIKSKLGQSRTQAFGTFNEALIQLYAAVTLRKKGHYQITRYLVEDLLYTFLLQYQLALPIKKNTATKAKGKPAPNALTKKRINHKSIDPNQASFCFQ